VRWKLKGRVTDLLSSAILQSIHTKVLAIVMSAVDYRDSYTTLADAENHQENIASRMLSYIALWFLSAYQLFYPL
jgi:hypothetical protein